MTVARITALILFQLSLHSSMWGGSAALDILPINPTVQEGGDVILNCYSSSPEVTVRWNQVSDRSSSIFSSHLTSFPGGMSLHLQNASLPVGKESSTNSFVCESSGQSAGGREITTVTVIPRNNSVPLQVDFTVIFPANPVVQNGSDISLICFDPSQQEANIEWFLPGDSSGKYSRRNVEKFANGAHLMIFGIIVDNEEDVVSAFCFKVGDRGALDSKPVGIIVREALPTTVPPVVTKLPNEPPSTTPPTSYPDSGATPGTGGVSTTLVLIAIAIGAGLAVFCVCLIFLSVYSLFYFRAQSWDVFGKSGAEDDVFKTTPRSIDNLHPYQSVTGLEGAASDEGGTGKSPYTELNQYDVAGSDGVARKGPYADLTPYAEPRLYARLESASSKDNLDVNVPDAGPEGIYEGEIGSQTTSFQFEETSRV